MWKKEQKIEILAPAGSYECFRAAINAGADAVYAGGARFGARAYADNFTGEELIRAIEEAHIHGRRFYLTVNTLVKDSERSQLCRDLAPLYERGLDAVIVQDIGVMKFIHENFPDMDIHGSTQMTITNVRGARFLEENGAVRVVPARELSLEEVRQIRKETGLEIECFVHGALCYCYSGQCLLSSMIGGRSGNRGQCAQPCRLPYTVNGKKAHYLSLKDICTVELIPELVEAGIDSFKIEGRMKRPEYVAGVTAMYRKYTDLYLENGREGYRVSLQDREQLMDLYNRGDSHTGYYVRHNGREMIALDRPNHAGVPAAKCISQQGREVQARALTDLHPQDVLEISGGKDDYTLGKEIKRGDTLRFLVPKGKRFPAGMIFRRTRNSQLLDNIRKIYVSEQKQEKIDGFLNLTVSRPAELTVCCGDVFFTAVSQETVARAQNRPLEKERICAQIRKTGGTEFCFETLKVEMDSDIFLPMQQLNSLRRTALEGLRDALAAERYRKAVPMPDLKTKAGEYSPRETGQKTPALSVLTETWEQLEEVISYAESAGPGNIERIYPDFHLCKDFLQNGRLRELLCKARELKIGIFPALPRIFRDRAAKYFEREYEAFESFPMDGVLIRNYESFQFLKEHGFDKTVILDHNLYVFNQWGKLFWKQHGVKEFTAPVELNSRELEKLGIRQGELIVYGLLPVMVTAQCIEKTVSGCSKKQTVQVLTDRCNEKYMVRNHCDQCYNVIYDSKPVSLLSEEENIRVLAPKRLRIQFSMEDAAQVRKVLEVFVKTFRDDEGEKDVSGVEREKDCTDFHSTTGHFKRGII